MREVLFKIAAFNLCEKRSVFSFFILRNRKLLRYNQAKCKGVNEFIYSFFSIRINQCDFCLSLIDKSLCLKVFKIIYPLPISKNKKKCRLRFPSLHLFSRIWVSYCKISCLI